MTTKAARPAKGRKCKVCSHPERDFLEKLLEQGLAPRAIVKRVGATTRKGLARHRDRCLRRSGEEAPEPTEEGVTPWPNGERRSH